MSKLLYIPTGIICSFHKEGSANRTVIIEESDMFKTERTIQNCLQKIILLCRAPNCIFSKVNSIPPDVRINITDFEIIND